MLSVYLQFALLLARNNTFVFLKLYYHFTITYV